FFVFFFQAEDGIRDLIVTGVQTCALPIFGSGWRGRLLVAGQLALSLPLLVGAGLFVKTLHNLKSSDLGFHAENVVTFDLSHPKRSEERRVGKECRSRRST